MTKEDREALEELRRAIGNPLNALKVYAPFKRLRAYYALHVHKNIVVHLQRSLGKMMLDAIFECDALLPRCQFGTLRGKLEATESFLHRMAFLLSAVEYLAESADVGVSIRQATEMVSLIKEIQAQMGGFKKFLQEEEYRRRSPQPTGAGSVQAVDKGEPRSYAELLHQSADEPVQCHECVERQHEQRQREHQQ